MDRCTEQETPLDDDESDDSDFDPNASTDGSDASEDDSEDEEDDEEDEDDRRFVVGDNEVSFGGDESFAVNEDDDSADDEETDEDSDEDEDDTDASFLAEQRIGGAGGLGPAWTRGGIEAPAGEKNMGSWTSACYTAEQQARLGVDENGDKAEPKPKPAGRFGGGGAGTAPAWTRGGAEAPAGEKNMGSYTIAQFTAEQQARLGVDANGDKAEPKPKTTGRFVGGAGGLGPVWTRGGIEAPAG